LRRRFRYGAEKGDPPPDRATADEQPWRRSGFSDRWSFNDH